LIKVIIKLFLYILLYIEIMEMNESKPRFFINPITGRMIKSRAKTFRNLKSLGYQVDKHKCLYDVKTAKKCLERILHLYPNIVYPSSNFINIPKTFKHGYIRAFIKHNNKIIGYIDKRGKKYKLYKPIHSTRKLPIVEDPFDSLHLILDKIDRISEKDQRLVEKQIKKSKHSHM
jgi:hypothetical protein